MTEANAQAPGDSLRAPTLKPPPRLSGVHPIIRPTGRPTAQTPSPTATTAPAPVPGPGKAPSKPTSKVIKRPSPTGRAAPATPPTPPPQGPAAARIQAAAAAKSRSTPAPGRARNAKAVADKYRSNKRNRHILDKNGNPMPQTDMKPLILLVSIIGALLLIIVTYLAIASSKQLSAKEAEMEAGRISYAAMKLEDEQTAALGLSAPKAEIDAMMADLKSKADSLIADGRHMAALSVYSSYRGRMAADTKAERERLVRELQTRYRSEIGVAPVRSTAASTAAAAPTPGPAAPPPPPPPPKEDITVEIF